ncbi:MAG: Mur ligase family protein [Candidatus Paceibacterota bacterium]
MLRFLRSLIPSKLLNLIRSPYHFLLACAGAFFYKHPSKDLTVIGVTGTKGKSTTVELLTAILNSAGYKTASTSTIRFSIGNKIQENKYKMTMPGRFFLQKFLSEAVEQNCAYAVLEMTSEGAKQHRHAFVHMNALVFLNLSPEHIDSHGSYEKYKKAKLSLAKALEGSPKGGRAIIVNSDDKEAPDFLSVDVEHKLTFSLNHAEKIKDTEEGLSFVYNGEHIVSSLRGHFNVYNICAALTVTEYFGIPTQTAKRAIALTDRIEGRVEEVKISQNQPFKVYVDYAHTPDSLKALYETFKDQRLVCVLGSAGGGRDRWKRPEMGKLAEKYCKYIILTNEDPYDEDPREIVEDIKKGMEKQKPKIIMERREAIKKALKKALSLSQDKKDGRQTIVLITGKGTDPFIMGPHGSREPWSDTGVTIEELKKVL